MLFGLRSRLDKRRAERALVRERAIIVEEAIEQLVNGIDPNMRLVIGYKKKLWQAVDKALIYIAWLVDTIPGPVACSRKAFASVPLINAVFATAADLQKTFSQSEALRAFFADAMNVNQDECYALMCMERKEQAGFGMELEGDLVKKDVPQVAVNFSGHNILSPAATVKEVRNSLKQCMFDALISNAFESVMVNHMREAGTDEYRKVLDKRYKANQAWNQELTSLILSIRADAMTGDTTSTKDTSVQNENGSLDNQIETPADHLAKVLDILTHPENMIRLDHISINLTRLGIKVKEDSVRAGNKINFTELVINDVWRRTIVLVRYPRDEMLVKAELF